MKTRKRETGALVAGVAMMIAGILAIEWGHAGWFGTVEITGIQSRLFGWASIVFSVAILFIYFRGTKEH